MIDDRLRCLLNAGTKILRYKFGDNRIATNLQPIYPYVLMDYVLQTYTAVVKRAEMKFGQKKLQNEWGRLYHEFNTELFGLLDENETCYITDLMDDLEIAVKGDLRALEEALKNLCGPHCGKTLDVCVSCLIANIYCKVAIALWNGKGGIYAFQNVPLENLRRVTIKLMDSVYKGCAHIQTNSDDKVVAATDALVQHLVLFRRDYERKIAKENGYECC